MNMITHRIQQGTQEWLDLRAQFHTASEANAMMGACSHTTRTQLLDQKKTGITPEPSHYEKTYLPWVIRLKGNGPPHR